MIMNSPSETGCGVSSCSLAGVDLKKTRDGVVRWVEEPQQWLFWQAWLAVPYNGFYGMNWNGRHESPGDA
jgi:hypothetical protein